MPLECARAQRRDKPRLLLSVVAVAVVLWARQVLKPCWRVVPTPVLLHLGVELPEQCLDGLVVPREVGSKRTMDENQLLVGHLELKAGRRWRRGEGEGRGRGRERGGGGGEKMRRKKGWKEGEHKRQVILCV